MSNNLWAELNLESRVTVHGLEDRAIQGHHIFTTMCLPVFFWSESGYESDFEYNGGHVRMRSLQSASVAEETGNVAKGTGIRVSGVCVNTQAYDELLQRLTARNIDYRHSWILDKTCKSLRENIPMLQTHQIVFLCSDRT